MTDYYPDDRRYMTFEQRAADDPRYRQPRTSTARTITTCSCGKTVTHQNGNPIMLDGKPVTCPRNCGPATHDRPLPD